MVVVVVMDASENVASKSPPGEVLRGLARHFSTLQLQQQHYRMVDGVPASYHTQLLRYLHSRIKPQNERVSRAWVGEDGRQNGYGHVNASQTTRQDNYDLDFCDIILNRWPN